MKKSSKVKRILSNGRSYRVLLCGSSDESYPRDRTLVKALQRLDRVELLDCRHKHRRWMGRTGGQSFVARLWKRVLRERIRRLVASGGVDAVLIMKNNHSLLRWLRKSIGRSRGPKLLYDLWVSRALVAERDDSDVGEAKRLEAEALRMADVGLVLTADYSDYYQKLYSCERSKLKVVPLAVSDEWLTALPVHKPSRNKFIVAYWGNFLKQHGLDILLNAARLLAHRKDIEFRLYGQPVDETSREMLFSSGGNINYFGRVPGNAELIASVDESDIGVGHLRRIHDAHLVLPNKVHEGLARGKPMINVYASPISDEDGSSISQHASYFDGSAEALAARIQELSVEGELSRSKGEDARACIEKVHSVPAIAKTLESLIIQSVG